MPLWLWTHPAVRYNLLAMANKVMPMLGAAAIVACILYVSVMWDSSMCYQVPGCPAIRGVILGY